MNNVNPTAVLRSLIVYAICIPVAILVGYMLTNPQDYQSIGFMGVLAAIMVFPLLMRWHYVLLIFTWGLPATVFFLPGHPPAFLAAVAVSLTISTVERILNRNIRGLPVPSVRWSLLALLFVVCFTAKLTGGFGLRSMGSDVYGGKKYVFLIVGILSFFAVTARAIPKKQANFYMLLFFSGSFFAILQDLAAILPSPLHFIYLVIPPLNAGMDEFGNQSIIFGTTRLMGIAGAASAFFYWMLSRNGLRGNFLTSKLWRPAVLVVALALVFLGGFRSSILFLVIVMGLMFLMEKMHRTGAMFVVVMAGILGGVLIIPLAPHLPYTFQRALAILPLNISPDARMDAEGSTQWRLDMWDALLPQVPKYLLLGKGYSFSAETFNDFMGANATFKKTIDAADNPLALSSDFHNGPLSVVIPLGIWGGIAWLWFMAAGFRVLWRNYHYGDPDLANVNRFLFAFFVAKCISFLFIAGSMVDDVGGFAAIIGLSVALNHGVSSRLPAPAASQGRPVAPPRPDYGRPGLPPQPALPALGR